MSQFNQPKPASHQQQRRTTHHPCGGGQQESDNAVTWQGDITYGVPEAIALLQAKQQQPQSRSYRCLTLGLK